MAVEAESSKKAADLLVVEASPELDELVDSREAWSLEVLVGPMAGSPAVSTYAEQEEEELEASNASLPPVYGGRFLLEQTGPDAETKNVDQPSSHCTSSSKMAGFWKPVSSDEFEDDRCNLLQNYGKDSHSYRAIRTSALNLRNLRSYMRIYGPFVSFDLRSSRSEGRLRKPLPWQIRDAYFLYRREFKILRKLVDGREIGEILPINYSQAQTIEARFRERKNGAALVACREHLPVQFGAVPDRDASKTADIPATHGSPLATAEKLLSGFPKGSTSLMHPQPFNKCGDGPLALARFSPAICALIAFFGCALGLCWRYAFSRVRTPQNKSHACKIGEALGKACLGAFCALPMLLWMLFTQMASIPLFMTTSPMRWYFGRGPIMAIW